MADPTKSLHPARRFIRYPLEVIGILIPYLFFKLLPPRTASDLGGYLGRKIGPKLGISKRAEKNIRFIFPKWNSEKVSSTTVQMWDNLGRVIAEMPHVRHIARWARTGELEIVNRDYLARFCQTGKPIIFFSGHFSNWELFPHINRELGASHSFVYRAPNNPLIDRLLRFFRRMDNEEMIRKGAKETKSLLTLLNRGGRLMLLVDQKMNDGIPILLLGQKAMTAPGVANLAFKYKCPVIPIKLQRIKGCNFRMTILPPVTHPDTGSKTGDINLMMTEVNEILGSWIEEDPDQWFWLHQRWTSR
jgi:KDO2-lipid IV(A) lauroyltransferase